MILLLLTLYGVLMCAVSNKYYHTLKNPILILFVWYGIFAWLSQSGIYGMKTADSDAVSFILANVLLITLIVLLTKKLKRVRTGIGVSLGSTQSYDGKIVKTIRWIIFIISLFIAVNLVIQIMSRTFMTSDLRSITYKVGHWGESNTHLLIYKSEWIYIIYSYFIRGYVLFDFGISFTRFVVKKIPLSALCVINVCFFCLIQLNRIEIFRMVVIALLIIAFSNRQIGVFKLLKQSKKLRRIAIVAGIFICAIISMRNYTEESYIGEAIKNLIGDMSGPYVAFGNAWNNYFNNMIDISTGVLPFFESALGGMSSICISFINTIFGTAFESANSIINTYTADAVLDIGIGYSFNAFYTMYFPPLVTGGIIGCIIMSLIYGVLLSHTYYRKDINSTQLWKFVYVLSIIMFGLFNYQWQSVSSWVTLILTFVIDRESEQ